jgi:uncharacterized protein (TIGR00266 family)
MEAEIRARPAFAHLAVSLQPGERLIAEAGAMASMSSSLELRTRWNGGIVRGLARRFLGGEAIFINEYTARAPGEVVLTQPFPGDLVRIDLQGETLYLQPGAFLACQPSVRLGLGWAGLRTYLAGEGLFRLKVSGHGAVWFGAYGAIFSREIDGEFIVDSGHLVAYEPTVTLRLGLAGGLFSSIFSGEGMVTKLYGPGRVYLQSRSFGGLAAWTNAHLF